MFSKLIASLLLASSLVSSVASTPMRVARGTNVTNAPASSSSASAVTPMSFNSWGGLSSMSGFDNFYGSGNFDGRKNDQKIIEREVVQCHRQEIEIVQQRLVILQEMAKRVISELVCDVETQVIVFEQYHRNTQRHRDDLRRDQGRMAGYDSNIASHYSNMLDSNNQLTTNDLGFNGQSVGNSTVVLGGTNWNNSTSPQSAMNAYNAVQSSSASLEA